MVLAWLYWLSEPSSPPLDLAPFASTGVVGALAASGLWFAYRAYQREAARADRLEAIITDKVIPTLADSTHAIKEVTQVVRDIQREQEHERIRREAGGQGRD